ncbi:putative flippase GtrA [Oxalobacteraceae bacterium GrIS 1.18]
MRRWIDWVLNQRVLRFLITGTLNTLLTYRLYLLFKTVLNYQLAYFLSYIVGILFTYVMSSLFVFKSPISLLTFIRFPLVYVVQYFFGAIILALAVKILGVSENIAPLIVIVFTLPITYLLSKFFLLKSNQK